MWEEGIEYQIYTPPFLDLTYDSPLRIKFYFPVLRQSFAYANRKSLPYDCYAMLESLTCVPLKDTHLLKQTVKAFVRATFGCLNVT